MRDGFDFGTLEQSQVDFVLPRLDRDIPLAIDPFLLFRSRYREFRELHNSILQIFNEGVRRFRSGKEDQARLIIDFPEVKEIGLGYGKASKRGSGLGIHLNQLLVETLGASPDLLERGVKHVEEMQLLSIGIGADRISDIAANILKQFLINYTQEQAELWKIPLRANVPVHHILDFDSYDWVDGYFDLPTNDAHEAMLLVPRWVVRVLPWINFEDYVRAEFSLFLRSKSARWKIDYDKNGRINKRDIVEVSRREIQRIDHYILKKEKTAHLAFPAEFKFAPDSIRKQCQLLIELLGKVQSGLSHAREYQLLMLEALNLLFEPDLIDGKAEEATILGTERRDIVFVNDSEKTFFEYIRNHHSNFLIVFEAKNVQDVSSAHFNQLATYLGDKTGYCAFMLVRNAVTKADKIKAVAIYNNLKRVIITLNDNDVTQMLVDRAEGKDPMRHLQKRYREFMTSIQ